MDIKKLNQRHFQIMDLYLQGFTNQEIAAQLSVHPNTVSIVVNSPNFQHEVAIRRGKIEDDVKDAIVQDKREESLIFLRSRLLRAAQRLNEHMESDKTSASLRACAEILDRGGVARAPQVSATVQRASFQIDEEQAQLLLETLRMVQ